MRAGRQDHRTDSYWSGHCAATGLVKTGNAVQSALP
jgi:hypothetical protein